MRIEHLQDRPRKKGKEKTWVESREGKTIDVS
jgi:hypothetical protein